ncbi:hypothetical protein [Sanyastnella coralliicola]|uniref:hypothetical protein n=1 Tax=Sanyastnella coralliicola TaxID=3069118 RepID=UPI0027B9B53E|nr:hypothetical protein [Longitalea sp. SCSIO 12813]
MRIAFSLGLLLLLSVAVKAQSKFSYDLILGIADQGYLHERNEGSSGFIFQYSFEDVQVVRMNYRFGVNVNYSLNDHVILKTGLRIDNQLRRAVYDVFEVIQTNDTSSYVQFELAGSQRNLYQETGFQVPLAVRFVTNGNKVKFFTELGLTGNLMLVNYSRRSGVENSSRFGSLFIDGTPSYNFATVDYFGSVGMDISLESGRALFFQPFFQTRTLSALNLRDSRYSYLLGVEFGWRKII